MLFPSPAAEQICSVSPLAEMSLQRLEGSVSIDEYLFGGCSPQSFISSLDKLPNRVSSTTDLIRVKFPSRASSTMDLIDI